VVSTNRRATRSHSTRRSTRTPGRAPGEYDAAIIPTEPGDCTFPEQDDPRKGRLTVTSSDSTFDTVKDPTDIQFPVKLPTLTDLTTRITQVDARVAAAQGTGSAGQASIDAAAASAASAQSAADRALAIGAGLGIVGIALGAIGIALALRSRRTAQA
jgi:hypothetical protein